MIRGVRGAITVKGNSKKEIIEATGKLLKKIVSINFIKIEDIASVFFSLTRDLDAEFPAAAARKLGWFYTPLLCTNEIPVPRSLEKCIRVLIHFNSEKMQKEIIPVYLGKAKKLRSGN